MMAISGAITMTTISYRDYYNNFKNNYGTRLVVVAVMVTDDEEKKSKKETIRFGE